MECENGKESFLPERNTKISTKRRKKFKRMAAKFSNNVFHFFNILCNIST